MYVVFIKYGIKSKKNNTLYVCMCILHKYMSKPMVAKVSSDLYRFLQSVCEELDVILKYEESGDGLDYVVIPDDVLTEERLFAYLRSRWHIVTPAMVDKKNQPVKDFGTGTDARQTKRARTNEEGCFPAVHSKITLLTEHCVVSRQFAQSLRDYYGLPPNWSFIPAKFEYTNNLSTTITNVFNGRQFFVVASGNVDRNVLLQFIGAVIFPQEDIKQIEVECGGDGSIVKIKIPLGHCTYGQLKQLIAKETGTRPDLQVLFKKQVSNVHDGMSRFSPTERDGEYNGEGAGIGCRQQKEKENETETMTDQGTNDAVYNDDDELVHHSNVLLLTLTQIVDFHWKQFPQQKDPLCPVDEGCVIYNGAKVVRVQPRGIKETIGAQQVHGITLCLEPKISVDGVYCATIKTPSSLYIHDTTGQQRNAFGSIGIAHSSLTDIPLHPVMSLRNMVAQYHGKFCFTHAWDMSIWNGAKPNATDTALLTLPFGAIVTITAHTIQHIVEVVVEDDDSMENVKRTYRCPFKFDFTNDKSYYNIVAQVNAVRMDDMHDTEDICLEIINHPENNKRNFIKNDKNELLTIINRNANQ